MQIKIILIVLISFFSQIPKAYSTDFFEPLPKDVKLFIFSKLSINDLLFCGQVSHGWRKYSSKNQIWRPHAIYWYGLPANGEMGTFYISKTAYLVLTKRYFITDYTRIEFSKLALDFYPFYKYMLLLKNIVISEKAIYKLKKFNELK